MADHSVDLLGEGCNGAVLNGLTLELSPDLSFDEWTRIGARLGQAHTRIQWLVGDWWIHGEDRYDNRRFEAPNIWGLDYHSCENYGVTARAFVGSRRREDLSFSHHAELTALPEAEADSLLDWCLTDAAVNGRPRSRNELRRERDWRERQKHLSRPQTPEEIAARRAKTDAQLTSLRNYLRKDGYDLAPGLLSMLTPKSALPPPKVTLDNSPGGGPLPDELRALAIEPAASESGVDLNRIAIAKAAFTKLESHEVVDFVVDCFHALDRAEQLKIRERLGF